MCGRDAEHLSPQLPNPGSWLSRGLAKERGPVLARGVLVKGEISAGDCTMLKCVLPR